MADSWHVHYDWSWASLADGGGRGVGDAVRVLWVRQQPKAQPQDCRHALLRRIHKLWHNACGAEGEPLMSALTEALTKASATNSK